MKIKFDPLIIFVFGLVAGIILSPLIRAQTASAASNLIQITPTGSFTATIVNNTHTTNNMGASHLFVYKNAEFPNQTDPSGALGGNPTVTIQTLVEALGFTKTGNTITGNLETFIGSNGDGNYWIQLMSTPGGITKVDNWYQLQRINGRWFSSYTPTIGANNVGFSKNTRFLSLSATSTATTTTNDPIDLEFDLSWFLDASEINRSVSALNPTGIKIRWVQTNVAGEEARTFAIASTTGTSSDTFFLDQFPANGAFTFVVTFTNVGCDLRINTCPFPDSYIYLDILMASGTVASSSAIEYYDTVGVQPEQETCSLTNISACITNALIYLFVPPGDALNGFLSIGDRLDTVKPFGYFTQALDAISGVGTSTSAYTMPDIPFQTAIFDPLRDGMAVMLWGIFAFVFYNKRLKNIDI